MTVQKLLAATALAGAAASLQAQPAVVYELGGKFDKSFNQAAYVGRVDVIFAAAGTSGVGILQATRDAGKLGIGVDSNQNAMHPGAILTSVLKRVDQAVYQAFKGVTPGVTALGLAEGSVGLAMDEHNAALVTPAMRARLESARKEIVDGRLKVVDYTVANACPAAR